MTNTSPVRNTSWPVNDERIIDATRMHVFFVEFERSISSHGPGARIVRRAAIGADVIDMFQIVSEGGLDWNDARQRSVSVKVIRRALKASFRIGAVIGDHHQDRIVELAGALKGINETASC